MSSSARVLLGEPDAPTRMGLRVALVRAGFEIAAEARDAGGAVDAACREHPDVALLAADLPGDGIGATRAIASRLPATRVLVLTDRQDGEELVSAVLAGASGYLAKHGSQSRLPRAVAGVLAGEAAVPRRYTEHILEALRGRQARRARIRPHAREVVTERQWEILNLVAEGVSTAEMAHRLGIAEVTARRHISAVLSKLGLRDRAGAVELMRGRSPE
jgi:DNA-binding NarL/FixJ family response regulator